MVLYSTRRQFLRTATAATLAGVAAPTLIPRSVLAQGDRPGANDRIGIAGIGVGRQGAPIFLEAAKDPRTQPICTCDVWKSRAESVAKKAGIELTFGDYRKVLDRSDVDAILTATPEHWRSLICVNAALAGKHIYAEKPITLTLEDGKLMRKAARKTNIVFQCGSMQRSMIQNYLGCQLIREGLLGKITSVISANYESPWIGNLPAQPKPDDLDWEMWCGPTDVVPYHLDLFTPRAKPGWLSFRPYSGGEMTGWGTHGFDQIQCALGLDDTGPVEIIVTGDKLELPVYNEPETKDRGDNICSSPALKYRYANGVEITLGTSNRGGGIFFGEKGKVGIFRAKVTSNPPELAEDYLKKHAATKIPTHIQDWLNCIPQRKRPIGDIETGIRTATVCHLLNIARLLGRNLKWDPVKEEFPNDAEATALMSRPHRKGYELPAV